MRIASRSLEALHLHWIHAAPKHRDPERPRAPFRELLAVVAQTTRLRVLSMSLQLHTVRLHGRQQTRWGTCCIRQPRSATVTAGHTVVDS